MYSQICAFFNLFDIFKTVFTVPSLLGTFCFVYFEAAGSLQQSFPFLPMDILNPQICVSSPFPNLCFHFIPAFLQFQP